MKLLFESYKYPKESVEQYISGLNLDNLIVYEDSVSISYVGYYYCQAENVNDIVFVLPKVFVHKPSCNNSTVEAKAFGQYDPVSIIDPAEYIHKLEESNAQTLGKSLDKILSEYVAQLSVWLYQTIHRYDIRNPHNTNCVRALNHGVISGKSRKTHDVTLMDRIVALQRFARDNRMFFTFVFQNSHSGFNRINWKRTITKCTPIIQDGSPVYIDIINRRKRINYEEELLVIFFSTLRHIKQRFGVDSYINEQFKLMSAVEFKQFSVRACRYLKSIKYRYFSDKSLELWSLLYEYYKKERQCASALSRDLLMVKKFDPVFEDMIDYLLSDENGIPSELREQRDGKRVDHIYRDNSLVVNNSQIFYIGDSKYYKEDATLELKSIAKQYTYAKNIIQRNIDVMYGFRQDGKPEEYYEYRDNLTEGYNVTPNFFISGMLFTDGQQRYKYDDANLEPISTDKGGNDVSRHFSDRLFDRDTLILQRFNINFLYVMNLYARHANGLRDTFRKNTRERFKEALTKRLDADYAFFKYDNIVNDADVSGLLDDHFRILYGKIYSFEWENTRTLILALPRTDIVGLSEQDIINSYGFGHTLKRVYLNEESVESADEGDSEPAEMDQEPPKWKIVSKINDELKFVQYLPFFTVKAACGYFVDGVSMEDLDVKWVDVSSELSKLNKSMFVVRASGASMEPKINDGDLCVFERYNPNNGGSRDGRIVLTQCVDEDANYGCCYTIKEYHSEKVYEEDGSWRHSKITLKPLNDSFKPIEIEENIDNNFATIGILKIILR